MALAADIVALMFVVGGLFFMFVGTVGLVRLPDLYNRLHAASKCSTLGLLGLLMGAVFHIGTPAMLTKAVLVILFAFVATPVGSHMLAKAALLTRTPTWPGTKRDGEEPPPTGKAPAGASAPEPETAEATRS